MGAQWGLCVLYYTVLGNISLMPCQQRASSHEYTCVIRSARNISCCAKRRARKSCVVAVYASNQRAMHVQSGPRCMARHRDLLLAVGTRGHTMCRGRGCVCVCVFMRGGRGVRYASLVVVAEVEEGRFGVHSCYCCCCCCWGLE